jgi:FixJ family two-component response regulator
MRGPWGVRREVYLVDDDEAIRDSLSLLFRSRVVSINTFASGEEFLATLDDDAAGCVVLDIQLEGK